MKFFSNASLLPFAAMATVVAAVKRNHTEQQNQATDRRQLLNRNHFPSGLRCNLHMKDIEYGPTIDNPQGYSIDEWFCELSQEDADRLGLAQPYYLDIADPASIIPANTKPGQSILTATKATIDVMDRTLHIPDKAKVSVVARQHTRSRNLVAKSGELQTLVIRVIDSRGISPDADREQLRNDIFKDRASLKTQYAACSYGKLKIKPYSGKTETKLQIHDGIVDLHIDYDASGGGQGGNRRALHDATLSSASQKIGDLRSQFDLILICMPPGSNGWLAYAIVNDQISVYNNKWCSFVSGQLHEVGHNLGLAHSGEVGQGEYADKQGVMGISYGFDDQKICFNPAKNYQLGWYEDKVKTIDPLSSDIYDGNSQLGVRTFTMNGVSDYRKNDNALIVLRLEQTSSEKDYYIGFNRKAGINKDTDEDGDALTIVRKESGLPDEFGESTKVAALQLGESYTIQKFNGKKRDIKINYIGYRKGDATIEVVDLKNAKNTIDDESGPCVRHKVEVMTDRLPDGIKWVVVEDGGIGRIHVKSPTYTENYSLYKTAFCLPMNVRYKFIIEDIREDALCSTNRGYYTGYDDNGNIIFSGDCMGEFRFKGIDEKTFTAIENASVDTFVPSMNPASSPSFIPSSIQSKILSRDPSSDSTKRKKKIGRRKPKLDNLLLETHTDPPIDLAIAAMLPATSPPIREFSYSQQDSAMITRLKPQSKKESRRQERKANRRRSRKRKKRRKKNHPVESPTPIPNTIINPINDVREELESLVERCVDSRNEFRYDKLEKTLFCHEVGEMKKCDVIELATRKELWFYCPKTCNRCMPSTKETQSNLEETVVLETWNGKCSDSNNEFRYDRFKKMLTCDEVGETKNCDAIDIVFKKQLWFFCPKTCKRCSSDSTSTRTTVEPIASSTPPTSMMPTPRPSTLPNPSSKGVEARSTCADDEAGLFALKKGMENMTCEEIHEEEKCDLIWFETNQPLWHACQKSCNRCDESFKLNDAPLVNTETEYFTRQVECKDDNEYPFWWRQGMRKATCQQISEKGKCDLNWYQTNKPLWQVCQKSCNMCDNTISIQETDEIII